MWVNMHVGESYAGQKKQQQLQWMNSYSEWKIWWVNNNSGWTCMWVNMHVSESYLDEKYADQKKRWVNVNVVQSSVGECSSGWNPRLPLLYISLGDHNTSPSPIPYILIW